MKKFILGFICAGLIFGSTLTFASAQITNVSMFPIEYFFNGKNKKMENEYTTLNYDGHAYVPIRFVADSMGAILDYDKEGQSINVNYIEPYEEFSRVGSIFEENKFVLTINSTKDSFARGEWIRIWSMFSYNGSNEVEIRHGDPLLRFYIKDSQGHYYDDPYFTILKSSKLIEGSSFLSNFNKGTIFNYNFLLKKASPDSDDAYILDAGQYTIGAIVKFSLDDTEKIYRTEIEVTVK